MPLLTAVALSAASGRNASEQVAGMDRNRWPESSEYAVKANTKENVRLTFEQKVENHFDEMAESNFKLLKRIVDDRQFGEVLMNGLFKRFWRVMEGGEEEQRKPM